MENSKEGAETDERRGTYMAEFGLSDEHVGSRLPSMDESNATSDATQADPFTQDVSRSSMDPVELARTEVKLAEARFSHRVRRVSDVSELAVREAWTSTRPLLIGALMIGGASATLALVAAVRTFRRRTPILIRHVDNSERKSPVLRSILMSVGLLVLRRVAERALDRLQTPHVEANVSGHSNADSGRNASYDDARL